MVYIREGYYFPLVCTFRKAIEIFEVKVDVQKKAQRIRIVWSVLGVFEQRSLYPFTLVHPKSLNLSHEFGKKPSTIDFLVLSNSRFHPLVSYGHSP